MPVQATMPDIEMQPLSKGPSPVLARSLKRPSLNRKIIREALPSLLSSMAGLLFSGYFLDIAQHWDVFKEHSELLIMMLVLLNLKGNLEMTLSSRLSTAANMGLLDEKQERQRTCTANVVFVQLQSVFFGFAVGLAAWLFGLPTLSSASLSKLLLLLNTGMLTASVSGLIVSSAMCFVIVQCRKARADPDNIAAPIAASLGDVTAAVTLALGSAAIYRLDSALISLVLLLALACQVAVLKTRLHGEFRSLLFSGSVPVAISIFISSIAGLIFEQFSGELPEMAVFLPTLNGVIGNIACIHASRMATDLHAGRRSESTAGTLALLNLPLQLVFLATLLLLLGTNVGPVFSMAYLACSTLLAASMLRISPLIVGYCWSRRLDPDTFAMPVLTAIGDLLGTASLFFLFLAFEGEGEG